MIDDYIVITTYLRSVKYQGSNLDEAMLIAEHTGFECTLYKNQTPIRWHSLISGWNKIAN